MPSQRKPEEIVQILFSRLEKAKQYALGKVPESNELDLKFKEIENELGSMKRLFPKIKHWEDQLMKEFKALEQQIDDDIFRECDKCDEILQHLSLITSSVVSIKQLFSAVERQLMDRIGTMRISSQQFPSREGVQYQKISEEWLRLGVEERILTSKTMLNFKKSFDCLESSQLKTCSLCLTIFPENSIIKKRPLIYWWMGEGLVTNMKDKTAEEVGEDVFKELINEGFIIPKSDNSAPNINSFMVHPWVRRMLTLVAKNLHFFDFDPTWTKPRNRYRRAFLFSENSDSYGATLDGETLAVFNVDKHYLGFKPDWLSKLNKVEVLQLGRWQNNMRHHIEVENEDLIVDHSKQKKVEYEVSLSGLGTQAFLRYLSLRGVSRITTLPNSIAKLISLEILDLRACHNLERLPSVISSLKKLTHLDVSECYLLESMPKGIQGLSLLQVLKGFVIGNMRKNPCRISDLAGLGSLRKLSIRIGKEALGEGEFASLKNFEALQILVISWGVVPVTPNPETSMKSFSVPPNLKKLDLRCAPMATASEWLRPGMLKHLEKLYVRGGELSRLDHGDENHWKVKILILKYLKKLRIEENTLLALFPEVEYLEKVKCNKDRNTYDPDIIWSKTQDRKAIVAAT